MIPTGFWMRWSVLAAALIAVMCVGANANARRAAPDRYEAQTARVLQASDTAHLRYLRSSGSWLYEEGSASGTLPGSMHVNADFGANGVAATFTIYTHGGTIKGRASATPHGSGVYQSFAGSLVANGGTGRYSHAHGSAGFYGIFDRKNYALTVQTAGKLYF